MYPRSFLCEEAKIKQRTPLKKELCEIDEEAIWESRFTSFFFHIFIPLRRIFNNFTFCWESIENLSLIHHKQTTDSKSLFPKPKSSFQESAIF